MIGTVAVVIITTAAVITALGVISRTRPVRWVFRRLVSDPLAAWFSALVGAEVSKQLDSRPLTNGWGAQTVYETAKAVGADVPEPRTHEGDS